MQMFIRKLRLFIKSTIWITQAVNTVNPMAMM